MKTLNPQPDISAYLSKFYTKTNEISSIINPLLKNIRQTKVSSYKQLQKFCSLRLENQCNNKNQIDKNTIFLQNSLNFPSKSQQQNQNTTQQKIINSIQKRQKIFSQTKTFLNNQIKFETLQPVSKNRNYSFNVRSRTSDHKKKYKKNSNIPSTADFPLKTDEVRVKKERFLFQNRRNSQQSFDDQITNYGQLKIFFKGPTFSGGKFSKFKKHLVEEINLQQIEKKFYNNPPTMTNYKHFFQKIINRRKRSQIQNRSLNKNYYHTISETGNKLVPKTQKSSPLKERDSQDSMRQSLSQTLQVGKSIYAGRGLNDDKRKRSVKAVFIYGKNGLNDSINIKKQIQPSIKTLDLIQVTGKKKNLLFNKK